MRQESGEGLRGVVRVREQENINVIKLISWA